VSDAADQASEEEELFRMEALRRQADKRPAGESLKWCLGLGCGDRIPEERRRAIPGVRLCMACQLRLEKEQRR